MRSNSPSLPQHPDFNKSVIMYPRQSESARNMDSASRACQKALGYELARQYLTQPVVMYADIDERN